MPIRQAVMAVPDIALDISIGIESQNKSMEIAVSKRRKYMAMSVEKSITPIPIYEGPYEVTPRLYYGHTLETTGKQMTDDVDVKAIPVVETSNPYGGKTVLIG